MDIYIPFSRLCIVYNCTEQFQLYATNSGKFSFNIFLLQILFPCYDFLDNTRHLKVDILFPNAWDF